MLTNLDESEHHHINSDEPIIEYPASPVAADNCESQIPDFKDMGRDSVTSLVAADDCESQILDFPDLEDMGYDSGITLSDGVEFIDLRAQISKALVAIINPNVGPIPELNQKLEIRLRTVHKV